MSIDVLCMTEGGRAEDLRQWRNRMAQQTTSDRYLAVLATVAKGDGSDVEINSRTVRGTTIEEMEAAIQRAREEAVESGREIVAGVVQLVTSEDIAWLEGEADGSA